MHNFALQNDTLSPSASPLTLLQAECSINETYGNDFDEAVEEAIATCNEFGKNNEFGSLKRMIGGWVFMEENDFFVDALAKEVEELPSIDVLCGLHEKTTTKINGTQGEEEENDEVECAQIKPTFDDINELAIQLKSISVTMDGWIDDYGVVMRDIDGASERLHSVYRKLE